MPFWYSLQAKPVTLPFAFFEFYLCAAVGSMHSGGSRWEWQLFTFTFAWQNERFGFAMLWLRILAGA